MIFPKPKKYSFTEIYKINNEITVSTDEKSYFCVDMIKTVFGEIHSDGSVFVKTVFAENFHPENREAYKIKMYREHGKIFAEIYSSNEKGIIRGLFCLKRMILSKDLFDGEIEDWPTFSLRGYIEGFYGKPWKASMRLEMLETMALFGENTHYYAPKDDPYHRKLWRELYPEKEKNNLGCLLQKAESLYIDFYYCIAPGLSMRYTSEEDFVALCEKTKQLFSMGIRNFGLLLDDIPKDLFYIEDKEKFGCAANAHVYLTEKYYSFLKSLSNECKLTVCPTDYHGKGDEEDFVAFAKNIPAEVSLFFTGTDICSKELTVNNSEVIFKNTNHKPLYWDNFPVNDAEMFMEMHICPVIGREAELYKMCEGLISNCMEYFYSNMIPLITVASYLWNPKDYDPEQSFMCALDFVLPEDEKDDFILLTDHTRTCCLNGENSRIMGEYLSKAAVLREIGEEEKSLCVLTEYTEKIRTAKKRISERKSPIYKELSQWIEKFSLMSEILDLALEVLKGENKKEELKNKMHEYNFLATVLTSFCFREYVESVLEYEDKR